MLILNEEEICSFDTSFIMPRVDDRRKARVGARRKEHYRTLLYISKQCNNKLFYDVGSRCGLSALCLGINPSNDVISWDIIDEGRKKYVHDFSNLNIKFKLKNVLEEPPDVYDKSDLILLDIEPHTGIQERKFLALLDQSKFSGLLIMDDIRFRRAPILAKLFDSIERPKEILSFAHSSGTGIVSYGTSLKVVYVHKEEVIL